MNNESFLNNEETNCFETITYVPFIRMCFLKAVMNKEFDDFMFNCVSQQDIPPPSGFFSEGVSRDT